ncbi:MAG: DEAD/DEAH box helicase family protein, partial [Candidatus Methanoplasma sp.]|nr:DEAD/DEAH box helicase family protein [Candidatus Methanoplasma sp.]
IYTKEELLMGQNFNPSTIMDQLSICVLSYDSLRSNKKDGRKMYQENSANQQFEKYYGNRDSLIENVDPTATMQVLNQLSPIVIVDESHNAESDLSIDMLINLNPSFILDLTATPRKNSNIISYTGASELKKENMVKLPVIVYNRNDMQDVLTDAIMLRGQIELQAIKEETETGRYVRPIVLFQAQPKSKTGSETYQKTKDKLISMGIPEDEVAIKTSDINEIKNVNLLSRNCKIRYIITVNALKEGWDCPFAYILATLANKTSAVDVEQILGRILRQPYAVQHKQPLMNMSYALTCSNDFRTTLENIVTGLNKAGFSRMDYREGSNDSKGTIFIDQGTGAWVQKGEEEPDGLDYGDPEAIKKALDYSKQPTPANEQLEKMMRVAEEQGEVFVKAISGTTDREMSPDLLNYTNVIKIDDVFLHEASALRIPKFFLKTEESLFSVGGTTLLEKDALVEDFTLKNKDRRINFETADSDAYKVDANGGANSSPKYEKLDQTQKAEFKGYFSEYVEQGDIRKSECKKKIMAILNKLDNVSDPELRAYIGDIIDNMKKDDLTALLIAPHGYAKKIKDKVLQLLSEHCEYEFEKKIRSGEIVCFPGYKLPESITLINSNARIAKSLYTTEGELNNLEHRVILEVASLENVKWWHRIVERAEGSFYLNGFINHYPDFMVMTKKGTLILIETKGDDRDNTDSRRKLKLGKEWQNKAGEKYRYFMVVEKDSFGIEDVITVGELIETLRKL